MKILSMIHIKNSNIHVDLGRSRRTKLITLDGWVPKWYYWCLPKSLVAIHIFVCLFQLRFACAVCLGYLTFNRTAARKLLVACRNTPGLYEKIMENIGPKPRISKEFTDEFKRALTIGLPCMSLEKHGGPPVIPVCKRPGSFYELPFFAH